MRYTGDKKDLERNTRNSKNSNFKKKIAALVMVGALSMSTGLVDKAKSYMDDSVKVEKAKVVMEKPSNISNQPAFEKFMRENGSEFYAMKRDLLRYKELIDMPNRSEKNEQELKAFAEKINTQYAEKIEAYCLKISKCKIADAYHMSPEDVKIQVDMESQSLYVRDLKSEKLLLDNKSKETTDLVVNLMSLANLQNDEPNNDFTKSRRANGLWLLNEKTAEIANKEYKLINNKFSEVTINKSKDVAQNKDEEMEI